MEHKVVSKSDFKIIGLTKRISNDNAPQEIPQMWKKFILENYLEKIPAKANTNLMSIYTNYEGDHSKPFDYTIGSEVSSIEEIPDGMNGIKVEPNKYALFEVKGKLPDALVDTWKYIWESDLKRKYDSDFEVVVSPNEIHVYISIE